MERGYIKLYRAVMDNFTWKKKPFSYGQAWAHMIMTANHRQGTIWVSGCPVKVERGQVGHSQETLQKDFGWTRATMRTFIKHLKSDHMVSLENVGKMSLITITNYDKYHGNDQVIDHKATMRQPTDNHETTANNKNKNNKNNKKEYISPRLGEHDNVKLTQSELDKLVEHTGKEKALDLIERLSGYIASKGDKYKSHYATMLNWHRKDGSGATKGTTPAMTQGQEAERNMLKNELDALYSTLENKKQIPEGHQLYEGAQRAMVKINKRIDEIEAQLRELEG